MSAAAINIGAFVIDTDRQALTDSDGQVVLLRGQSLAVLMELARRPYQVVTKRELMKSVWTGVQVTDDSLVQCIADVRRALRDDEHRLVRTIHGRGYMLCPPRPQESGGPDPLAGGRAKSYWGNRVRWVFGAVAIATVVIGSQIWNHGEREYPRTPYAAELAVLPFKSDVPHGLDPEEALGLVYDLANEFARTPDLRVIGPMSSAQLARQGLPAKEIAQRLRVRYLVDGTAQRKGDELVMNIHLLDAEQDQIVWARSVRARAEEIPAAWLDLLERIAATVHSSVRAMREQSALSAKPRNMDVYLKVLRGVALKHRMTVEDLRSARHILTEAVAEDPNYAPGWLYLGFVNAADVAQGATGEVGPADLERAIDQLNRALRLDPALPAAYHGLAVAYRAQRRYPEVLQAARRAVELGPGDPDGLAFLSIGLSINGRFDEGLKSIDRAIELNPLHPGYYLLMRAVALWGLERFPEAESVARQCFTTSTALNMCRLIWLSSIVRQGRRDEALRLHAEALKKYPRLVEAPMELFGPAASPAQERLTADIGWLREGSMKGLAAAVN